MAEKIAAVYKIINIKNSKVYIGSSVDIRNRWNAHIRLLNKNKHHSYKLQGAWNKHGKDSFIFEIIETLVFPKDYDINLKCAHLESVEDFYIKSFDVLGNKGYNVSGNAGRPQITREGIKKGVQTRRNNGSLKFTEERKRKISEILKNSEVHKKAMKDNGHKWRKFIYVYNLEGEFLFEVKGIEECVKCTGVSYGCITKCLYNKKNLKGKGYMFNRIKVEKMIPWKVSKDKTKKKFSPVIERDLEGKVLKVYNGGKPEFLEVTGRSGYFFDYRIHSKSPYDGKILEYARKA